MDSNVENMNAFVDEADHLEKFLGSDWIMNTELCAKVESVIEIANLLKMGDLTGTYKYFRYLMIDAEADLESQKAPEYEDVRCV